MHRAVIVRATTILQTTTSRDLRNFKSVVAHPGSASTDHVTASRLSENTMVAELLNRISAITRRDLLQYSALPRGVSPAGGAPQGGILKHSE